jgi:hypothetical protein
MEACVGAHHLSRKLQLCGQDARLMPAKYRKLDRSGENNIVKSSNYRGAAYQERRLVSTGKACDGDAVTD